MSRTVQVRLKHVLSSEVRWSRNEVVTRSRYWTEATVRPDTDEEPAEGAIACGDCAVVVTYRLLTAGRTRHRRRILGGLTLVAWALVPTTVALIVRGTFGSYDFVVLFVVCGALVPALTVVFASENGLRVVKTTEPGGRRARSHQVDVVHPDDRPRR